MAAVPLPAAPQSPEGFYAVNNKCLINGPKGFHEYKLLEHEDMFVRMDFPDVPEDGVSLTLDPTKKAVMIIAHAPKVHSHDFSHRIYRTVIGLHCSCCEISGFTSQMLDGVLRLRLSKTNIAPQRPSCIAFLGPPEFREDPGLTGPFLMPHPNVYHGSTMSYESKQLENGSLYMRLDMPGVPKGNFNVTVARGIVKVTGQAPAVSHDSNGRFYSSDVAMLSAPVDVPGRKIKTIIKNGVIRLLIPRV